MIIRYEQNGEVLTEESSKICFKETEVIIHETDEAIISVPICDILQILADDDINLTLYQSFDNERDGLPIIENVHSILFGNRMCSVNYGPDNNRLINIRIDSISVIDEDLN